MRLTIWYSRSLLVLFLAAPIQLMSHVCSAQEAAPYAATVVVNEAPIRSGPAAKYYVTDLLDRGANVEVHKNISGWCAIRPPKGSFSWVPSRQVRLDDSGKIAEVIDPETYAWIGSNLGRVKEHGYQIQLHVGEKLAIIGEKRFERRTEQVTETYYKVEPPSGEFRWVESRFLSKPPASATNMIAAAPIEKPAETVQETSPAAQASHDEPVKEPAPLPSSTSRSAQPLVNQSSLPAPKRTGFRDVTNGYDAPASSENRSTTNPPISKGAPNQRVSFVAPFEADDLQNAPLGNTSHTSSSAAQLVGGDFNDQLAALEAQLAMSVAQHPRDWNLAVLRAKANQLKDAGATPLERGRASLVLDRISLYETHQKQSLELDVQRAAKTADENSESNKKAAPGAPWKPAEEEAVPPTASQQEPPNPETAEKKASWMDKVSEVVGNGRKGNSVQSTPTHFDAQGKLQKVRANDDSTPYPDYALVNDEGVITAFVDSPVLKFEKYLGKRIGVYGRRGMHTASQTAYIEAVELVDLEITQRTKPMRTTFGTLK